MKYRQRRSEWLCALQERRAFIISAALFLFVLLVCVLYVRLLVSPMSSLDISPASLPDRWRFTAEDGTPLTAEDNRLPLTGENNVVVCALPFPEAVTDKPLLVISAIHSDCVVYLDDHLVYSPSGRYENGHFSDSPYERSAAWGQAVLNATGGPRTLTVVAQLQGGENRLSRLPQLTLYPEVIHYLTQYTSPVAEDAIPAGMFFAVALFVTGLFLIGLWKGKRDYGLPLLALCSLTMAVSRTASFSQNAAVYFQSPTVTWFCSAVPLAAMGWALWYRLTKKLRLLALPLLALPTGATLALLILGFASLSWAGQMNATISWVLPGALLATLLAAAWDAARGNRWFRGFFRYAAWSIPAVGAMWAFSFFGGGKFAQALQAAFSHIGNAYHSLYELGMLLCKLLLILCFLRAVLELIHSLARQDAEMRALALREKYAIENLELMRKSQEETRAQRHEMRHHLIVLREMLAQGQDGQAADYVVSLLEQVEALPSGTYSDNLIVNAIVAYYLTLARQEGVVTEVDIRPGKGLPIREEEACVLLTNALENALEACRACRNRQERFLSLRLSANEKHLILTCKNGTDAQTAIAPDGTIPSSKPDAQNHGYGIPAMRRIVEKHEGMLTLSNQDGCFTVEVFI